MKERKYTEEEVSKKFDIALDLMIGICFIICTITYLLAKLWEVTHIYTWLILLTGLIFIASGLFKKFLLSKE